MYSVVLAVALVGGAEAVECHRGYCGSCCFSCGGFYGGYNTGCYYGGGMVYGGHFGQPYYPPMGDPKKDQVYYPGHATIVVNLPADATLTIDDFVSQQTSGQRYLSTPLIQPGEQLTYTLVAESMQDGQRVSQSQLVTVTRGQVVPVNFTFSSPAAVGDR